jgi:hypothetical protein
MSGSVAAQLSVAEILRFDRDFHPIGILSKTTAPAAVVCVVPAHLAELHAEALRTLSQEAANVFNVAEWRTITLNQYV